MKPYINLSIVYFIIFNANFEGERRKQILKWINEKDTTLTHESNRADHTPGGGAWFLASPEFENWIDGKSSNTLICYGIHTFLCFDPR